MTLVQQIALISDTHGNLPALEAVLADIDRRGVTTIHCLGDLAGKGPSGSRVVDICRERCAVTLLGNWDVYLSQPQEHAAAQWWRQELGPERCAWLGSLPFAHDFVLSGQRMRLVHASPQGIFHRVRQRDADDRLEAMFDATDLTDPAFIPDVVGYGDIHTAFVRTFPGKILVNVGSAGNSLSSTQADYALLEGNIGDTAAAPWSIRIVQVPYDTERAIADAHATGAPELDKWTFELTTGRYRGVMPENWTRSQG